MEKPSWWPRNPYPESIFPMNLERYQEIVPDPDLRTALSGCLGRMFWDIASQMIWESFGEGIDDGQVVIVPEGKQMECSSCGQVLSAPISDWRLL